MKKWILPALLLLTSAAFAQTPVKIKSSEIFPEIMKTPGVLPHKALAIWYPSEIWEVISSEMGIPADAAAQLTEVMGEYQIFAVVDYVVSAYGLTYASEDEVRGSIRLVDSAKMSYRPLTEKDVNPNVIMMLNQLKPALRKMSGEMGEHMYFFLYNPKTQGMPTMNITRRNNFSLIWNDFSVKWSLPLAAALPPKFCPVDKEQMKGNWNFCPEHGVKL